VRRHHRLHGARDAREPQVLVWRRRLEPRRAHVHHALGYPPFYGKTENDKVEKILTAKFDFNHAVWDDVSDSAKNFICRCLALQPKQRWSVKELLKHPWITGVAREGDARAEGKVLAPLQSRRRLNEFAQEVKNSKRAGGTPQGAATVNVAVEETKKKKKDHK
jgi:serine/threonine protein kinase